MKSKFQNLYNKIVGQQKIIEENFLAELMAMQKAKKEKNDNNLYNDSGNGAVNDLYVTVVKLKTLFSSKGFNDAPQDAFKSLRNYLSSKDGFSKEKVKAAAKDINVDDGSDNGKPVLEAVSTFKEKIAEAVKKANANVTQETLTVIDFIVEAFKYNKDNVISILDSTIQSTENVDEKVKSVISQLSNIKISALSFSEQVATNIAANLGKISVTNSDILHSVGTTIADNAADFYNDINITNDKTASENKEFCDAAKQEIQNTINNISKLSDAAAATPQASSENTENNA